VTCIANKLNNFILRGRVLSVRSYLNLALLCSCKYFGLISHQSIVLDDRFNLYDFALSGLGLQSFSDGRGKRLERNPLFHFDNGTGLVNEHIPAVAIHGHLSLIVGLSVLVLH